MAGLEAFPCPFLCSEALVTDQRIICVSIPTKVTSGVKCSGTVLLDPFRGALDEAWLPPVRESLIR